MQHYRAFQIDDHGQVFGCFNLACEDDADAKRQAMALRSICRIELWRLDKRIALIEARKEAATTVRSDRAR